MPDDPLIIDDYYRYSRFRLIAWWEQEKLAAAKILVVGAGALGNEVLKNLAMLGIGTVYVVDFDEIEESNLTRSILFRQKDRGREKAEVAAESLLDINPEIRVKPISANIITDVGLGLFRDVDVVIGCLDNREARLWVNRQCWKVTTPWIDGGIQEINGVAKVFLPPDGACYECAMTENDYRLINLRYSCPLLRHEDILAGKVPTAPTIASMIGGLQTQEALKLIHGMDVAEGTALVYNGVANQFYSTKYQHREDCLSHETFPDPIELPLSVAEHRASDLFAAAKTHFENADELKLVLDRDVVVSLDCAQCDVQQPVMKPMQLVGMRDAKCPKCGETCRANIEHIISSSGGYANNKMSELGIPPYDIVRVSANNDEKVFLLTGDRDRVVV